MSLGGSDKHISTDVLVIGGGMAGCFSAIKAKGQGLDVTLIDKGYVGKSGATHYSEGDFVFFRPELGHKLNAWMDGINTVSEYVNNRDWSEIVLKEGHERYDDLVSWGIKFYEEGGKIHVNRSRGGIPMPNWENISMINREYAPSLRKKVLASGVRVLDRIMVCELLKQGGRVVGVVAFHITSGSLYIFEARAIVLASGGAQSFKNENMPTHYRTADGEAMAYRAGAEIAGKEFVSNRLVCGMPRSAAAGHLYTWTSTKVSEGAWKEVDLVTRFPAFRGDDGSIWLPPSINAEGGPVFSAIWEAHCGRAPVYVDLDAYTTEQMEFLQFYYQRIGTTQSDKVGFDPTKGGKYKFHTNLGLRVIPGGSQGIWPINTRGATILPGLFAAGDACATLASGASYAGLGFALCHASVTGNRAGLAAAEYALKSKKITIDEAELMRVKKIVCAPVERKGGFGPDWLTQVLQGIILPYFIIHVKHGERLQAALTLVEFLGNHLVPKIKAKDAHEWRKAQETKNMVLNAEMVLRASLFRTESRGTHFREDFPRRDDPTWLAWVKLKEEQGKMKVSKEPIPKEWWPDLSRSYEERYPLMFAGE